MSVNALKLKEDVGRVARYNLYIDGAARQLDDFAAGGRHLEKDIAPSI